MIATAEESFGAVIVNYNSAALALDSALSFLGGGGKRVIIVDNASPDGSIDYLRQVLSGEIDHHIEKPVDPCVHGETVFADLENIRWSICDVGDDISRDDQITLIASGLNRGFAAGVNIGLSGLLLHGFERFLVLNPDALINKSGLAAFAHRLEDKTIGLCGASVVDFAAPHFVQALGGAKFNRITLTGENIGEGKLFNPGIDQDAIEQKLNYPLGAAIAFRRDFLSVAGFLDERYFLYYEEIDWASSGGSQYKVGWAKGAIVYHRYGVSTKSKKSNATIASRRSSLGDYHMVRSRALFAKKWAPWLVPSSMLLGVAQAIVRVCRGELMNARAVFLGSLPRARRIFSRS